MQVRAAFFCCSLALTGCASRPAAAPPRTVWLPAYAFGFIGGGDLDLRDVCPGGIAEELSVGSSWSTLGISFATLGVYTPRQAQVRCRAR